MEDAIACFESDEYQSAAAFRRDGSGEVENVIIEATEGDGNWSGKCEAGFVLLYSGNELVTQASESSPKLKSNCDVVEVRN